MNSPEAHKPKNIKEIIHAMVYFDCPACGTPMIPDICLASPSAGCFTDGKRTVIDPEGKEATLVSAYIQCPECKTIFSAPLDIQ